MTPNISLMQWVDLTCLKSAVVPQDIETLSQLATMHQCAAVCVWPQHLSWVPKASSLTKATVVNFPHGHAHSDSVKAQIDQVLQEHPQTEIDYVFPYTDYWSGHEQQAIKACADIAKHCQDHQVPLKVILETGYVQDEEKLLNLAQKILEYPVAMLKTSTGFFSVGATPAAVRAICQAIVKSQSPAGIKVSGGIRSLSQAQNYYDLILSIIARPPNRAWLRFGCSQVLT